jgi:hypothetical protein
MDFLPDSPCSALVEGITDVDSPSPCLAELGQLSGSPIHCAHELGDEAYSGGCPNKRKHPDPNDCADATATTAMEVTTTEDGGCAYQQDATVPLPSSSIMGATVSAEVSTGCDGGGCPKEECEDLKRYLLHEMSQVTAQN